MNSIKKLFKDGALHIIGAGTINKIISFCSGILIVRILSQTDYGIYTYVLNIVEIFLLTNGFGTMTGILQYGCEYKDDIKNKNGIIQFGIKIGLCTSIVIAAAIGIYGLCAQEAFENSGLFLLTAACIPIMNYVVSGTEYLLRLDDMNKQYGYYSVLSSVLTLSAIIIGAFTLSVIGAITFRYIAGFIIMLFALLRYKNVRQEVFGKRYCADKQVKKGFISFSLFSCANNSIAHLFYTIDVFLIGIFIADADIIAAYKVATTIPFALTFLTSSIITYVYPKIVAHKNDKAFLIGYYKKLILCLLLLNGIIFVIGFFCAPYIIGLIYGKGYVDQSTMAFKILMVGFLVSSVLRIPAGNILDMLHMIKSNFIVSIVSCVFNIILDIIFIKIWGTIGAAIATSLVYFIYGALSNSLIIGYIVKMKTCDNNVIENKLVNTVESIENDTLTQTGEEEMDRPRWILHLCGRLSVGGVQTMLMSFYRNIDREKVQFAFAVQRDFEYDYDREILAMGGRIHYLPDMIEDRNGYKKALEQLIGEHPEYKAVHCHFNHRNHVMLSVAKKMNVPIRISHAHASNEKKRLTTKVHLGFLSYRIRKYATDLLSCSHAAGRYLYCSENYTIIHNAINLDKFGFSSDARDRLRQQLNIDDDTFAIGQIGHVDENKNQLFSIDVLKGLPKNYKLFIVGDGDLRERVEAKIEESGMSERIKLLGIRDDVNLLLSAFDALIFPSYHEGLGVVCVEAQACKLPVVASDNVPDEIKITDLVTQISLQDREEWVRVFSSMTKQDRTSIGRELYDAGYEIKEEAAKLEKYYLNAYERES